MTVGQQAAPRTELVEQYLAAAGLPAGPPTRALLDELVRSHVAAFPFSSVGVRLGDELPLDLAPVHDRIVVRRRGGYCFEHNSLMFEVLGELGYDVRMYLGRVLLSGDPHPGLTHRVSVVTLDDADYLVDVGFGPQGPTAAVPFDGTPVGAAWRQFRLLRRGPAEFVTQAGRDERFDDMYRFELARYGRSDCEVGHFYSYRHPESHFVTTLIASRILDDEVRSLRNRDYWVLRAGGTEQSRVVDAADLRRVLVGELGFGLSDDECGRLFAAIADT